MCLALYLGSDVAVTSPQSIRPGGLGIEPARWVPSPLAQHKFVYYLGRLGDSAELECACLLVEHIHWDDQPTVFSDDLYPDEAICPFETLQMYCREATGLTGWATLVSDDSGGVEQASSPGDYDDGGYLPLHLIARRSLLFADMPRRRWHLINVPPTIARHPLSES